MIANAGGARSEMRVAIARVSELDMTGTSKTPWRDVGGYSAGIEGAIPHGDRLYLRNAQEAAACKLPLAEQAVPKISAN